MKLMLQLVSSPSNELSGRLLTQPKVRYDFLSATSTTLPQAIFEFICEQQKALENRMFPRA